MCPEEHVYLHNICVVACLCIQQSFSLLLYSTVRFGLFFIIISPTHVVPWDTKYSVYCKLISIYHGWYHRDQTLCQHILQVLRHTCECLEMLSKAFIINFLSLLFYKSMTFFCLLSYLFAYLLCVWVRALKCVFVWWLSFLSFDWYQFFPNIV